jgi:hypothetical protein
MDKINLFGIVTALLLIIFIVCAIYKQIQEHYLQDDPELNKIRYILEKFFIEHKIWEGCLSPLNQRDIMNETNLYRGGKSYTINKSKIFICLKDEKGEYYPVNFLMYVVLHEKSHAICDEIGHTQKFHEIFQALLNEAAKAGIYNPEEPILQNYCENGDPEMF